MKSWQERGFVPDSDEEDEFESQDSKKQVKDKQGGIEEDGTTTITINEDENVDVRDDNDDAAEEGFQADESQKVQPSMELDSDGEEEEDTLIPLDTGEGQREELSEDESQRLPMSMELDSVDGQSKLTRGNSQHEEQQLPPSSAPVEDQLTQNGDEIVTEAGQMDPSSDSELPDAATPRPLGARPTDRVFDIFDFPSSPDELQIERQRPWRPPLPLVKRRDEEGSRPELVSENEDLSPLSSAPSSFGSLDSPSSRQDDHRDEPVKPTNRLEDLLPPLEIPEEILQELSQRGRRSLRQRNPIQMHPYLLEDARYQSLMKARGVRPVRLPNGGHQPPNETDESQEQDSLAIPEPPSSSPAADFQFPPSSPVEPYETISARPQGRTPKSQIWQSSSLTTRAPLRKDFHTAKRRKLFHSDIRPSSNLEVVIDNTSSPNEPESHSVFDIPPSPPRSGSLSSTQTVQAPSGFRFPRGFTPPTLDTPVTESRSKQASNAGDESLPGPEGRQEHAESGESSESEREPAAEEQPEDEKIEVKRLRRKIKGVLPASWLRLDLKQQEEQRTKSKQRHRDNDISQRLDSTKGVARKIIRSRSHSGTPSNRTNRPIFAKEHSGPDDDSSVETDSRKALAGLVGFDDPFDDLRNDDDIPEDNRIDYMLPSASSKSKPSGTRKHKKRDKPEHHGQNQPVRKEPRLKRQTRITDSVFRERRARRAPPKPPRLGILDAPDVAKRSRQDQPQFLRVAARQARSRRDGGRTSPSHKFFKLGTRNDTEDANISLRDWRRGTIRQTEITRPSSTKQRQRQPLIDLSTNGQDVSSRRGSQREVCDNRITDPGAIGVDKMDTASEDNSNQDVSIAAEVRRSAITSRKPPAPERRGNKWVIPRKFAVSSLKRHDPRPAEFESVGIDQDRLTPSLFQKSLSILNGSYRRAHLPRRLKPSLTLDRFLSSTVPSTAPVLSALKPPTIETDVSEPSLPRPHVQRQVRKRRPKRINTDAAEHQQPLALTFEDSGAVSAVSLDEFKPAAPVSKGFGVLKSSYSIDFNIAPLQLGTYFHDSTFIGSGQFARSLEVLVRDLDKEAGYCFIQIGERNCRWGAWNDTVASELGLVYDLIVDETEKGDAVEQDMLPVATPRTMDNLYRSVVKYVTDKLWFIDPVDRTVFVERCVDLVSKLNDQITMLAPIPQKRRHSRLRAAIFNAVFASQVQQIACHDLVHLSKADRALTLVKETLKQLISLIFSQQGLTEIRCLLEENNLHERREAGIRDDYPVVDAYVVARHILDSKPAFKGYLEESSTAALLSAYAGELGNVKDVTFLEQIWHGIFTILPLNEIDQFGISQVGSRFRRPQTNWPIVRSLLLKVLDCYDTECATQPASLNNYCRVLFHRCFHLINGWGWRDCKIILDTLFDFFARNTLHNLKNEESFGSPSFLDELDSHPSLEVLPGDPCFHILLKIIASGLRFMSEIYDKKKIRNFAWRLLPNHGRVYPKDKPLHREDLDALRNHHDLLCTLFWAVPDGCRPRLETIRNLVDPASSHRETCSISLRSWARLVRFKLSTNEDLGGLDQFAEWHGHFVTELVKQHSLARTEVEAQSNADLRFSRQLVESTISQNQRQIESLLSTALSGLKNAIEAAPSLEHAQVLVSKLPIHRLVGLFNPKQSRVDKVVSETLEVLMSYTRKDDSPSLPSAVAAVNDDSQEYGDWTGIEEICEGGSDQPIPAIQHVETIFHPAVSRLVSNCFGEDHCPEDAILLKVVDCWTAIAHSLTKHRLRHWDQYLSPYDGDSWATLRTTIQTRKFTPQFLARCMEIDAQFYPECKHQVLRMWMSCLAERASLLKFQHHLTETLLNQDPESPVLKNLPFSRDRKTDRYHVTLEEFCGRRLSLISSLLSNMREHVQLLEDTADRGFTNTREEYRELIESLMTSMKANYQELGNGAGSAQGAYVAFVHSIVGFLQQHTQGICPIDKFFTDPASFPLPATDPTYIVARLKSYGLRLFTGKVAKPLVVFIQSVSERAALDGQQVYLVDQLYTSMADAYEVGDQRKPTLRSFLLQCVFPAYIQSAFSNASAWILALPVLQTISRTFAEMLLNMDTTDLNCVSSVTDIFCTVFESSYRAMHLLVDHAGMLDEPTVLITIASFLEMITSALPVIDYIDRNTDSGKVLVRQLQVFRQFTLFAATSLFDPGMAVNPDTLNGCFDVFSGRGSTPAAVPRLFQEARAFAARELQTSLRTNWSRHEGKYFIRRGHQPREVSIDLSQGAESVELAKARFVDAVEVFFGTLQDLDIFGEGAGETVRQTTEVGLEDCGRADLMV